MYASKVSLRALLQAERAVGVHAEVEPIGRRFRVKLFPLVTDSMYRWRQYTAETCPRRPCSTECDHRSRTSRYSDERGDAKYQRESVGYGSVGYRSAGRRVNAVCWHGFRDFFRAVFAQEPEAVFRTALDTWKGAEDFEKRFPESGRKNLGSPIAPVSIVDACRCPDRGVAG